MVEHGVNREDLIILEPTVWLCYVMMKCMASRQELCREKLNLSNGVSYANSVINSANATFKAL